MAGSKPEIGARIVLDGAEEYQRSLKEVANAQKDLNKEMKLAESEFKATGNAQQLYNEKVRLLNAQMDNQKKKLETAQKALKELSDKGVDKNSDLWRKWNGILLDSQTKMNNLQAELNSTTAAMKDTADATEQVTQATERATQETADYSGTLKSIDKGVKFQNVLKGLGLIKDAVGAVISTAYRMGKALVMSQISGGDWAREIMTEAAKAGVSVEEYQARLYAQAVGGINTDAITEGVKKTTENLATTDTELLKLYNDLGISTRNADGTVRDATDTFWDSVDALKGIEDQTTRSIYAQKLLGDQYLELRGLVDLGSEGYKKLIEEGKASATVTEESVNALADMDSAFERVKATAKATGHDVQAELAPGFTAMAEAAADVLREFNEFLDSSEGKAKVAEWNDAVSSFADTIKAADFKTALDGIEATVNAIAAAMKVIGEAWSMIRQDFTQFRIITSPETRAKVKERAKKESLFESLTKGTSLLDFEETTDGNGAGNAVGSSAAANVLESASGWSGIKQEVNGFYGDLIKSAMKEAESTASDGGEKAIKAFNTAVEQEGEKTSKVMKSLVSDAFSGFDALFASMGNAHGQAYVNALYAQMARVNTMLSLSPSYAYGGSLFTPSAVTPASLAKQNANIGLYVGREKVAEVFTPIIDGQLGADIQTMR